MRFHGTITLHRYTERFKSEPTDIFADYFEADSIQSAKSKLTRIANTTELFSWIQSWDNEKRTYTGKDVRWRAWDRPHEYTQDDGKVICCSYKSSERVTGEALPNETGDPRYTQHAGYTVNIALRWRRESKDA